jgi:hypothetical protein
MTAPSPMPGTSVGAQSVGEAKSEGLPDLVVPGAQIRRMVQQFLAGRAHGPVTS